MSGNKHWRKRNEESTTIPSREEIPDV